MIYILLALSGYLVWYDIKYLKVPNKIIIMLLVLVLLDSFITDTVKESLIAEGLSLLFFIVVYIITKGKIGIGYIKFSLVSAMYVGIITWYYSLSISVGIGLMFFVIAVISSKSLLSKKIPFVPFLFAGLVITGLFQIIKGA